MGVHLREAVILAVLICTPDVVRRHLKVGCWRWAVIDPDHGVLRDLILRHGHEGADVLREEDFERTGPRRP